MEKPVITVDDVRLHLMDYDTVNIPLYSKILSNSEIQSTIDYVIDDFNETPPILNRIYTIEDFPYKRLLLDGAVAKSFGLTALKELRGEMQYNDGGIASTISYKFPQFTQIRQELEQTYERNKARSKRHLNMTACYGGIS